MNKVQTIATRSGLPLRVETHNQEHEWWVSLQMPAGSNCVLHWGIQGREGNDWRIPPESLWPPGTQSAAQKALQTPFISQNGQATLQIRLRPSSAYSVLEFVLFFPDERRWDNNDGRNYQIALTQPEGAALPLPDVLEARLGDAQRAFERIFEIEGRWQLAAGVTKLNEGYRVLLLTNLPGNPVLHWGIARRSPHEWLLPAEPMRGAETIVLQNQTAQTPFALRDGLRTLQLDFPEREAPLGMQFVLKEGDRWLKHRGGNFYIPIHTGLPPAKPLSGSQLAELADEIIRAEIGHNSWTLMHRFNLCYDLLERVRNDLEGQALLYVWLRFSAIRQLTWQRNYNTKPRELAHAQDRLTHKIAELYRLEPHGRPLARLTLGTVGRGGEGQRIRDEILNIMHRHHVKEVSGHFLEEWHQKLHNNTTPDDVVICEAYLEFLRNNGNLDRFYQTLEADGVTRQRLESFERPIRSSPQFVPHLKDGLLHDFRAFLKTLKASHSGTDLETALNAARSQLDGHLQDALNYLWEHRNVSAAALVDFVARITDARRRLSNLLHGERSSRELLYLDLALEQLLRGVVERNIHLQLTGDLLTDLIACVLENVTLSYEDPELAAPRQGGRRPH
jgi:alpha-glucan,water dikinase